MADQVLAGDLNAGDLITLPGGADVVIRQVRIGRGGFLLTVGPAGGGPDSDRVITRTADSPMSRRGHAAGL